MEDCLSRLGDRNRYPLSAAADISYCIVRLRDLNMREFVRTIGELLMLTIIMAGLVVSPYMTLFLFHPGAGEFSLPEKFEYFLDIQISQIEPLIISGLILGFTLLTEKVHNRTAVIAVTIIGHLIVAFCLITIRSEGGLRWLN
jgi:hypothetical protein